jgi:two-component system chemotaxis response regulator CheY
VPRALVVDDADAIRRVVRRALEGAGWDVDEASDGAEALQRFRAHPADVVLTDIYMEGIDGIQFTRALTKEFAGVPVIAMSGGAVQGAAEALEIAGRLGACATLAKPFTADQLVAAVERARKDTSP